MEKSRTLVNLLNEPRSPEMQKAVEEAKAKFAEDERIAVELTVFGPSKDEEPDPNDFPLGKACDLSGEGSCESCQ